MGIEDQGGRGRELLPVTILTGYLGSGKTTLLRRLLEHPQFSDCAVLINEIGEVGVDHHLVRQVHEDAVVLPNGCICCTVRGELVSALRELLFGRGRDGMARYSRVFVETTGLADPAPVAQALVRDPFVMQHYRLDGIVTVVDAVFGMRQLDRHRESVRQAAVADRIVISKTDLAEPVLINALTGRLRVINPAAQMVASAHGMIDPALVVNTGAVHALSEPSHVLRWLSAGKYRKVGRPQSYVAKAAEPAIHDDAIRSFVVEFSRPLTTELLLEALGLIAAAHGPRLLRIKGLVQLDGEDNPMVVHAVQHVVYPLARLPGWPDGPRRSLLVFIVQDMDHEQVVRMLAAVLGADALAGADSSRITTDC